ncbi:MAG: M57 family metalloprotease [Bacteroidota bacterium]
MNLKLFTATLILGTVIFTSCSDVSQPSVTPKQETISKETAAKIKALGFNPDNASKIAEGYLVENDIILTDQDLAKGALMYDKSAPKEEQYRTTQLVTGLPRVIKVKVATTLSTIFVQGTDEMIARYNSQSLLITFQRVTSGTANINITKDETLPSGVLGSGGFPTSSGNPYGTIKMKPSTFGSSPSLGFVATVLTHEVGHCIGFRHTDYMARVCGGGNEGSAGIGAILIPGTPSTIDNASFMISCAGSNVPFSSYDKIALNALY